jgi:hypothetical protein
MQAGLDNVFREIGARSREWFIAQPLVVPLRGTLRYVSPNPGVALRSTARLFEFDRYAVGIWGWSYGVAG